MSGGYSSYSCRCCCPTPPPPPPSMLACLFYFKVPQFTYFTAPSANSEFWFSICPVATAAIVANVAAGSIATHPTSASPSYARTIIATCLFNFKKPQFTYFTAPSANSEFWFSICPAATAAIVADVAACSIAEIIQKFVTNF